MKKYPDMSEIFRRKSAQRRALAALPFEEKIEIVFKMKARREFIKTGKPVTSENVADKIPDQETN